jgi:ferrochelatase
MAYGTPNSENDVEAYLTEIRRGQKPGPDAVEDLKERYRKIGGRSPLLDITIAQASALENVLNSDGVKAKVYVGMKHWHPYIGEVVPKIAADGFSRIIAIALAPHYSQIGIGGYRQALDKAVGPSHQLQVDFVESWYDHPQFHRAVAERVAEALAQFPVQARKKVEVIFTAHSLPERILEENDPYPKQFHDSCVAVADLLKINHWSSAYQSAGKTGEKWLGPDILEALEKLSSHVKHFGGNVLVVPIGFVADHLEILYDIDVEAQFFAKGHGLNLKRTQSLNTNPAFISALADVVRKRLN